MNSLRGRLLLFLIPVTALALAVTGAGIERAVRADLEAAMESRLLLLARGIASALNYEVDGELEFDLEEGGMPEFANSARESFYAVAAEGGEILFSSAAAPPALFGRWSEELQYIDIVVGEDAMKICLFSFEREPEVDAEDIADWLAEHPENRSPSPGTARFQVAAGLSDGELRGTLTLLRRRLAAGFSLLGLFLVLFPVWAAGVSLKPLRRLSRQAEEVGPDRPDSRLGEEGVPREVLSLVSGLNRALDRLGRAYEQQKRFTADAAHELRTPLSALRAQCEVTLRKERGAEELRGVVESVRRITLHLGELVENLLSLTRLQNGSAPRPVAEVDLAAVGREAASLLDPLAKAKDVAIAVSLPPDIVVSGDRVLLEECLSNLIDNALRYSPEGGKVAVEGGGAPHPWIAVADEGAGIAAEHREKIFERFYRVDPARSRRDGGSGLGLSIAREIARLHGAEIEVESAPGKGSRFTLRFERPPDPG